MRRILDEIQDGSFAREWLAENRGGRPNFERMRQADRDHEIERVGAAAPGHDAVVGGGEGGGRAAGAPEPKEPAAAEGRRPVS